MRDSKFNEIFQRLQKSPFRAKFKLSVADKKYIADKGIDTIRSHCQDFVKKRLAPAVIPNDGKQTPMRGHPVFVAQHATACCCRGCRGLYQSKITFKFYLVVDICCATYF